MCTTFKGHWTIPTHCGFLFRYGTGMSALSAAAACQPILFEHHQFLFDNRWHCALSSSLWNWELSNCMETQLFCVFTLRVSVRVCGCTGVCVRVPAIIIIDRISICCAFFMPRLQWNPFGVSSATTATRRRRRRRRLLAGPGAWGIYTIYCWWFYKCA